MMTTTTTPTSRATRMTWGPDADGRAVAGRVPARALGARSTTLPTGPDAARRPRQLDLGRSSRRPGCSAASRRRRGDVGRDRFRRPSCTSGSFCRP